MENKPSTEKIWSSAINALRALSKKSTVTATGTVLSSAMTDPAIAGAHLRAKNVVELGNDPNFTNRARYAGQLHAALKIAESNFEAVKSEARSYALEKRDLYNSAFKASVVTVAIPYSVDTPTGPETRYMQVVCSNRYSVNQDMVLASRKELGGLFDRLFTLEETKVLKPNAENLIRDLLVEQGMNREEVDIIMDELLDTKNRVSVSKNYEQTSAEIKDPRIRAFLEQAVTRAAPSLKF
jgi:DNA polymerase III delta prime subunit